MTMVQGATSRNVSRMAQYKCSNCGGTSQRLKKDINPQLNFCSQRCRSLWLQRGNRFKQGNATLRARRIATVTDGPYKGCRAKVLKISRNFGELGAKSFRYAKLDIGLQGQWVCEQWLSQKNT